MEQSSNLIPGF